MHTLLRTILVIALAVGISGCGGAGGDDVGHGVVVNPPAAPHALGARGIPGGTVAVSSAGAITPGALTSFQLVIGGDLVPTRVTAWISAEELPPDAGIEAQPVATGAGRYAVDLVVPSPLAAGSHVWVRLAFADGSLIETGAGDFLLVGN